MSKNSDRSSSADRDDRPLSALAGIITALPLGIAIWFGLFVLGMWIFGG